MTCHHPATDSTMNATLVGRVGGLLLVVAVLVSIVAASRRTSPMFPVSDEAMTEIYTLQATHGQQLTGPYSRFGWHHPGPVYFYFLVPFYEAAGRRTAGLNAGALVSNLLMVAVIGWALARNRQHALLVGFAVLMFLYARPLNELLVSSWNAHVAVLPLAATLVTAALALAGDHVLLPVVVAIGSFAVQTHLAVAPGVALCAGAALTVPLVRARPDGTRDPAPWVFTVIVAAILWIVPLVESLKNGGGNIHLLLAFFSSSPPSLRSMSAGPQAWCDLVTAVLRSDLRVPAGLPFEASGGTVTRSLAVAELVLLAGVAMAKRRAGDRGFAWLASLALVTSLVALYAASHIPEDLTDHQVFWISALGMVNATIILGALVAWANEVASVPTGIKRSMVLLVVGSFSLWLVYSGLSGMAAVGIRSRHPSSEERFVRATTRVLSDIFARQPGRHVTLRVDPATWQVTAGLLLQLEKAGVPCSVDAALAMYGEQFRPRGTEDFEVAIVKADGHSLFADRPGCDLLFERDDVFAYGCSLVR
jgi:hypothetical protein